MVFLIVVVKAEVTLFPRNVRVCPGHEELVVITCHQGILGLTVLQWEIQAPPMLTGTAFVPQSAETPTGTPIPFSSERLPGVNVTLHNISDSGIFSSVAVDTSQYNLTDSEVIVTCSKNSPLSTSAVIQLWSINHSYIASNVHNN